VGRPRTLPRHRETPIVKVVGVVRDLGERVALRCAELGLTYEDLALRLGYPRLGGPRICQIVSVKTIKYERLVKLAQALEWDSLAPLFERIPTFAEKTYHARRKLKRNIAVAIAGASRAEPTERGRK
jgi:transcriptional regulator with XRE-family HTH domain